MKILLIDDHPLFRAGLELLLKEMEPSAVVLHAGTCAEGIAIAQKKPLNLALLDLNLPDGYGLECLQSMKAVRPSLPVVVISGEPVERTTVERALELNAMGFVPKSENAEMIAAALRAVLAGGVFVPASLYDKSRSFAPPGCQPARSGETDHQGVQPLNEPCKAEDLGITKRQGDVLRQLVQGLPNKRIATKLGISVAVVKKHVSDLLAHFRVLSRTQLVVEIARRGVIFGSPEVSDPRDEITLEDA